MPRWLCIRVLVLCGVALLGLSGCLGSTPPTHFYLLPPLTSGDTASPASAGQREVTLAVGPVTVPVWSKNSCSFTRVVFQQSPEPFTTLHQALTLCVLADCRKEQHVVLALMIPLVMKMLDILRQRMAERRFPKQDEP